MKTALAAHIRARGMSVPQLAALTGYSVNTVMQVVSGKAASWPAFRSRVATALEMGEDALFPRA